MLGSIISMLVGKKALALVIFKRVNRSGIQDERQVVRPVCHEPIYYSSLEIETARFTSSMTSCKGVFCTSGVAGCQEKLDRTSVLLL